LIHRTPTPRSAWAIVMPVVSLRAFLPVDGLWCWPVAEVYLLSTITRTESCLLYTALATPLVSPLCQKPPSPITEITRLPNAGATAPAEARPMPYPSTELPTLNGAWVENVVHPMSAATWVSPMAGSFERRIFIALNTGRSGQPVQNDGGRLSMGCGSAARTRAAWPVRAA
jgi:hypothetical protein